MRKRIYAAGTLALLALTACSSQVAQTNAQLQVYAEEAPGSCRCTKPTTLMWTQGYTN